MWATLALTAALQALPAQNGQMQLKNARFTYGILGQERKDSTFLPGDVAILSFDIEGLKVAADGGIRFSMGFELTSKEKNGKTKSWYKKDPEEVSTTNTLGGGRRTEFAMANIGTDTPAGEYTMTVTVADVAAGGKPVSLQRTFTVKPPQFGIVQPNFMYLDLDARNPAPPQLAPPVSVPGKHMWLRFRVVHFAMKGDNAPEPNISVTVEVKDEKGGPVPKKPYKGEVKQIGEDYKKLNFIPFWIPIQVTRAGNFTLVITATDNHANRKDTLSLKLKVVDTEK